MGKTAAYIEGVHAYIHLNRSHDRETNFIMFLIYTIYS